MNKQNQTKTRPLGITDVVLRDAHQSLLATRLRIEDMLPIAGKLDELGLWSVESWGGATFDACIRYLGEDPWERIRALKKAMPKTRQQMLLRGQNLLGYRHYADDVVEKFVERAAVNGVDVFRIFDAMNDVRNLKTAIAAVLKMGEKHAQGTISYTLSPVHTIETWVEMAKQIEDLGAHSIAIKDMAGLLKPYVAFELVSRLKEAVSIPIHMQCHATTGLSTATALKAVEAGIDNIDTAISSMSMTYGHSPTESIVAMLEGTERDTGLNLELLADIAAYFRDVRKKYQQFEGSLRGVDARILVAQVPGGMLTNMENQLKEQGALDKFDAVLEEIPRVREDLGFIPLVTPTSQIVGTQAVLNVLTGERYKSISKETQGILKGEYGKAPAPFNAQLQNKVLASKEPITCRPADLLQAEMESLSAELRSKVQAEGISLAKNDNEVDDVLTYALFPQIGLKFLKNRGNPEAFEKPPAVFQEPPEQQVTPTQQQAGQPGFYNVKVQGQSYLVEVSDASGAQILDHTQQAPATVNSTAATVSSSSSGTGAPVVAPLAGNIFKIQVSPGQRVSEGDVLLVLEAMKMETEVRAATAGAVQTIIVKEGDSVAVGDLLLNIA